MSKKIKSNLRSICCNAKVKVGGGENCKDPKAQITMWHVCTKCNNPCDVIIKERKTWEINPKTRIVPNKKKEKKLKQLQKELREE